ncbi:amidase [Xinfangfangia sp. D13-10-4-6]|uniref:amidase n=1 Tax=Pseudogemmobacter hezensis TaxID=2737662 RepID=UPI001556C0F3|nr:amidase [Pseudogemmobacter hezensis]NPD14001.1 amidase [Pseudogemmobacter hezensis]
MDLTSQSALTLSRLIRTREVKPSEVIGAHLAQIAAVNPQVNAVVSLREPDQIMEEALALDDQAPEGALFGLPLAVKDLLQTKGIRTTFGSPLYADHVPKADDLIASRMRGAGAVLIGKTNTPEWGHGSHSFNPVFGATRNPYDLGLTAGGSSGGAAAALAAHMVPLADGSDMMGSLRNPAAFCNVYGFRPSWGLVPTDAGYETFLDTMATEGPMARDIADIALLLGVQAGPNPLTPFGQAPQDYLGAVGAAPADLKGKRFAWFGDFGGQLQFEPGIIAACEAGLRVLEDLGAEVVPVSLPLPVADLWQAWITIRSFLNFGNKGAEMRNPAHWQQLKPETQWEIESGASVTAEALWQASKIRSRWYARAHEMLEGFDALVMPVAQVWPFPVGWRYPQAINGVEMDTYHRWMEVVVPVSLIGLPSLAVPVGFGANGLPMGMQIAGRHGADAAVLALGQAYHQATLWPQKRPPQI